MILSLSLSLSLVERLDIILTAQLPLALFSETFFHGELVITEKSDHYREHLYIKLLKHVFFSSLPVRLLQTQYSMLEKHIKMGSYINRKKEKITNGCDEPTLCYHDDNDDYYYHIWIFLLYSTTQYSWNGRESTLG